MQQVKGHSVLRRVKTYLKTTITQERLSNSLLLPVHQENLDTFHLLANTEEFVSGSKHISSLFGHFCSVCNL